MTKDDNDMSYLPESAKGMRKLLTSPQYSHTERRKLFHYGVDLWGIRYNDPQNVALAEVRALQNSSKNDGNVPDDFSIKVLKSDLSKIWLYDHFSNRDICIPAVDQGYTKGLSYYKHEHIRKYINKQRKYDIDELSLAEARRQLQKIVKQEYSKTSIQRSRKQLRRVLGKNISNDD
jgi:putative transposase